MSSGVPISATFSKKVQFDDYSAALPQRYQIILFGPGGGLLLRAFDEYLKKDSTDFHHSCVSF